MTGGRFALLEVLDVDPADDEPPRLLPFPAANVGPDHAAENAAADERQHNAIGRMLFAVFGVQVFPTCSPDARRKLRGKRKPAR